MDFRYQPFIVFTWFPQPRKYNFPGHFLICKIQGISRAWKMNLLFFMFSRQQGNSVLSYQNLYSELHWQITRNLILICTKPDLAAVGKLKYNIGRHDIEWCVTSWYWGITMWWSKSTTMLTTITTKKNMFGWNSFTSKLMSRLIYHYSNNVLLEIYEAFKPNN